MKILGVDYGKRKVGLSISEGLVASPFKVLEVSSLKDAVSKISNVVEKEGIEEIVIGVPESGESRGMVKSFIREWQGINLIEHHETLSTHQAKERLWVLGKGRGEDDAMSASIILQDYLDEKQK